MTTRVICIVALLALCLSAPAYAVIGPWSVTVEQTGPEEWEYTLCKAPGDAEPFYLDLNWEGVFLEDGEPLSEFEIIGSPEADGWFANTSDPPLPFPRWDYFTDSESYPGECLGGFVLSAPTPALYFHVYYQDDSGSLCDQMGNVDRVLEPGSLAALFSGLAGLGLVIRRRV